MDSEFKEKVSCTDQSKRVKETGYNKLRYTSLILLISIIAVSCDFFKVKENKTGILAKVYDKELTVEDIVNIIPKNISKTDSLDILNRYIRSWVTKQLLLKNAETKITYNEAEVERKLLDYRYALIVYEYEKKYIQENLDTIITEEEIRDYYSKNIDNFELKQNIIKGMFVKVPPRAPRLQKLKSLMQSRKKDYKTIRSYCYRFANNYVLEDTIWNNFEEVIINSPFSNIPDKVQFLKRTKFAETSDSTHIYLLYINDYKIIDQNSPIEFVKGQIINIIINKRKVELVQKLEREIFNTALKNNDFEVFTENN